MNWTREVPFIVLIKLTSSKPPQIRHRMSSTELWRRRPTHPGLRRNGAVHSVHEQRITAAWVVYVLRCSVPKWGVAGNPISLAQEGASQAKALRNLICAFQALSSLSLIYPTRCGGVQQLCETRFPFIAVIAYCSCQKAGKSVWWDVAPPTPQTAKLLTKLIKEG